MDLDDFLASQYRASAEPGAFTLNPLRAKEQIVESLRFEAWGFPRHFLAAAFLGGANRLEGGTPGQFQMGADKFLTERRAPEYFFECDCRCLSFEEMEKLDDWLLQPQERFQYRLALTFHQMKTLGLQKFYFESWLGPTYHRLMVTTEQQQLTTHKKPLWQKPFRGLRLFAWEHGHSNSWSRKPDPVDDIRRTGLKEAALWSPVRVTLNKKVLNERSHPVTRLAWEYWENPERPLSFDGEATSSQGEYSMLALVDRDKLGSRFYPVVEGVTLKVQGLPVLHSDSLNLPGLRLVVHSNQFKSDASELALVREQNSLALLENTEKIIKKVRDTLLDPGKNTNRWYILRHWHALKDHRLREFALFELKSGQRTSLSQLRRWREAGTLNLEADLHAKDAQFASSLLPPEEPYTFRHGYGEATMVSVSPLGRWAALVCKRWCHILPLEKTDEVQTLPCVPGIDPIAWHPHQPWLALKQDLRVIVWDVVEQTILHTLNAGDYTGLFFSADGAWLQAILIDAASTQRWSTEDWTLQKPSLQTDGYTRLFKDCLVVNLNDDCLSIVSATPPHQTMATLATPKVIWQVLDVSPDQYYVAYYYDEFSIYLLDLLRFSFERIPIPPDLVLFSWDSNFLFYKEDEQIRTYSLETRRPRLKSHPCRGVLRSGVGLNYEEMGNNLVKTETEPVLALAQPPPLGGRDVLVSVTGSDDHRKAVLLSAQGCRVLWTYAPWHLFALTDTYLAWSSHDGVTKLDLESGEIVFLEKHLLQGRRIVSYIPPEFSGIYSPLHGTASRFELQVKRYEGVRIVDLSEERELESDSALTTDFNGSYQIACPAQNEEVDHFRFRHIDAECSWISDFPEGAHGSLHPTDSLLLLSSSVSTQILRLTPEGYVPLKQGLPGCYPRYSPSGQYFALASGEGLTFYRSKNSQYLGFLYLGQAEVSDWNWLNDQCLQFGPYLYRACSARGWKNPGQVLGTVPHKLHSRQSSEIGLVQEDGEIHFYSLLTGRRLGVLHPMGRAWFFHNHKGEWEASDKALRFVTPQPNQDPKPGILAALFYG